MLDFGDAERRILHYFNGIRRIFFEGQEWNVVEAGKPTCSFGEPKTDIFVLIESDNCYRELKVSYKMENADFIENKINCTRAEQILGPSWREIIEDATLSIREEFERRQVIFREQSGRTERGSITLGWKFELVNRPNGDLSGRLDLFPRQVYDVYAGNNLSSDKRNSYVNGRMIENSGIADYILVTNNARSAQDVVNMMIPIEVYIQDHPDIFFACKALNYRSFIKKYDGDRPLAVQVDWNIRNNKMYHVLVFDSPLEFNGDRVANKLINCMRLLNIHTTDDINENNTEL